MTVVPVAWPVRLTAASSIGSVQAHLPCGTQPALEHGPCVRAREQQLAQRAPARRRAGHQVRGLGRRVDGELEAFVDRGLGGVRARSRGGGQGLGPPVRLIDRRGRDARVGGVIGEREQHARQRDAVGDAVVHAREHGGAGPIALDHVQVPQWLGAVQRRDHQVGDQRLQRRLVARRRQGEPVHVQIEVEVRDVLPARHAEPQGRLGDALAETREALDEALAHHLSRALDVQRLVEPQQRVDHHEVRGAVHVQPRCVGGAHSVAGHVLVSS